MGDEGEAAPPVDEFTAIKEKYAALRAPILAEREPYAAKLAALNESFAAELPPLLTAQQAADAAVEAKIAAGESIDALGCKSKGARDFLLGSLAVFDSQILQIVSQETDERKALEAKKAAEAAEAAGA